uniref:Catenin (cadherin-associated protein), delta 1 n=1 Tax=Oryzias latipes TaxID=8090 RepID=A0A3P9KBQ9_ORYLA
MGGHTTPNDYRYQQAPLARGERGSMASIDSIQKRGPGPGGWRQPELSEVIAMLNYRLDAVQLNAAAYLQHLTYQNDKVKSELRNLKGIPPIVALVDHPNKEVYFAACGALRNISFGKDPEIKSTIVNCDGAFCLVKLLRKTNDRSLIEIITGTLWNLSSNEALFKTLIERALTALTDEILVLHSGVKQSSAGAEEGKEKGTSPYPEWEKVLINTTGFLRNVSAAEIDERKKIRECKGLIDSVVHIIKSQTDPENKLTENCVCVLRNLSYHLHIEIPNHDHYKETASSMRGQRFGLGKTAVDCGCWELLCQPDLIKEYGRLLDSKNPHVLEASAGAIQNLCAGDWTCGREVRAKVMEQKSYEKMVKHLDHENELVIQAMSGALCNLALDPLHTTELGLMAVPKLMSKLPDGEGPLMYSEQTRMAVLSALYVILEDPKKTQELYKLVQLKDPDNRYSEREVRAASLVLQKLWDHKGLRRTLLKNKYKKTDFELTKKTPSNKKSKGSSEKEAPKEKGPEETTHLLQERRDSKDDPGDMNFEKGKLNLKQQQKYTHLTLLFYYGIDKVSFSVQLF